MAALTHPIRVGTWIEYKVRAGVRAGQVMYVESNLDDTLHFYDIRARESDDILTDTIEHCEVLRILERQEGDVADWLLARI